MKRCTRCGNRRRDESFHHNSRTSDGLTFWCKRCQASYSKQWRTANKDRELTKQRARYSTAAGKRYKRNHHLRKTYGISLSDYHALRRKQKGLCAICKRYFGNRLVVDHNHSTGSVRGLLCQGCNTGLHLFERGRKLITKVMRYLNVFPRGIK